MTGQYKIETCSFQEIQSIWKEQLWPARKSPIEPCSAMQWLGGVDMDLMQATPTFWRVVLDSNKKVGSSVTVAPNVAGVLSGHFGGIIEVGESDQQIDHQIRSYRTRGLWVSSEHRRAGVAKLLMQAAFQQARQEGCSVAWTFPRQDSMPFYESVGFQRVGDWIGENDARAGEFGPNCFAISYLAKQP